VSAPVINIYLAGCIGINQNDVAVQINIVKDTGDTMASTWSKMPRRKKIKYSVISVLWFVVLALVMWINLP
jgi:hypothetical protein